MEFLQYVDNWPAAIACSCIVLAVAWIIVTYIKGLLGKC